MAFLAVGNLDQNELLAGGRSCTGLLPSRGWWGVVKPCSSMQVPRLSWKEKQAIESDTWIISAVFFSYSGSPILDISWHDVTEINKNILAKYVVFFVIDNFFAIFSNKICNYSNIYVYIYFFSQVLQVWNPGLSFHWYQQAHHFITQNPPNCSWPTWLESSQIPDQPRSEAPMPLLAGNRSALVCILVLLLHGVWYRVSTWPKF